MDLSAKEKIYSDIVDKYTKIQTEKYEKKIDTILNDLVNQNRRSLIIVGCAYLEELCKNCFYETMTSKGKIEYNKRHDKELTFSSASTFLFSQDYISDEIFILINSIREIRNKYAHFPIIEENHVSYIKHRNEKIRNLLNGRYFSRDIERIKILTDVDDQLYFILFENMIYGLMALEMLILPNQKFARLQFVSNEKMLRISVNIAEINEHSEQYFRDKFNK